MSDAWIVYQFGEIKSKLAAVGFRADVDGGFFRIMTGDGLQDQYYLAEERFERFLSAARMLLAIVENPERFGLQHANL